MRGVPLDFTVEAAWQTGGGVNLGQRTGDRLDVTTQRDRALIADGFLSLSALRTPDEKREEACRPHDSREQLRRQAGQARQHREQYADSNQPMGRRIVAPQQRRRVVLQVGELVRADSDGLGFLEARQECISEQDGRPPQAGHRERVGDHTTTEIYLLEAWGGQAARIRKCGKGPKE